MQRVEMFKAEDGEVFDNKEDCKAYEVRLLIDKELCNAIYFRDSENEEVVSWIISNFNWLKEVLEGVK